MQADSTRSGVTRRIGNRIAQTASVVFAEESIADEADCDSRDAERLDAALHIPDGRGDECEAGNDTETARSRHVRRPADGLEPEPPADCRRGSGSKQEHDGASGDENRREKRDDAADARPERGALERGEARVVASHWLGSSRIVRSSRSASVATIFRISVGDTLPGSEVCTVVRGLLEAVVGRLISVGPWLGEFGRRPRPLDGDVVAGTAEGRTSRDEITIFDSGGTGIETVAGAYLLYEKAREAGLGQTIDFAPGSEALTGE